MLWTKEMDAFGSRPLRQLVQKLRDVRHAGRDGGFVCRIGGGRTARGPAVERHFPRGLQVVADLCRPNGSLLETDIEAVNQDEHIALPRLPPGCELIVQPLPELVMRQGAYSREPEASRRPSKRIQRRHQAVPIDPGL